jgi:hypothetical protein
LRQARRHRAAEEAVDRALAEDHIALVSHLHARRIVSEHEAGPSLARAVYPPAARAQLLRRWVHRLRLGLLVALHLQPR